MTDNYLDLFIDSATRVGAEVKKLADLKEAASYISETVSTTVLVPETTLVQRHNLRTLLKAAGVDVYNGNFRDAGRMPGAGVTFSNFALADSGTVVLESTAEDIRLATTLPEIHCILVDPSTILSDNLAAVEPMTTFHQGSEARFIAYITGPSRTADIERVLTIGCHGPRELHILLVDNISSDLTEN